MRRMRHYLRFALFMAMLLAIASPATAQPVIIDGIEYLIYYEGDGENADCKYAICTRAHDNGITIANIRSSVSEKLEWEDYEYNEVLDDWIWVTHSRQITARVTTIANNAFWGCESLTSVNIPNTVTEIGSDAFYDCSRLTSVTIPNSVTEIGGGAFYNCSSLTSIIIPNTVTEIGDAAFGGCTSLKNVTIPNSVTEIGDETFIQCSSLKNVAILGSISYIGEMAFAGCSSLKSVEIPNSVTEIMYQAFSSCVSMTSVIIPSSVTFIGGYAFGGCTGLKDIYSRIENPADVSLSTKVFYNVPYQSCALHVPPGSEDLYREARQWKDFFIKGSYEMKTAFSKGFANSFPSSVEPKGVTADGASRMFIYLDEDISSVKSVTKKIKIDGQEVTDPAIIGNFGSFRKLPNGKFGFDYCAPEDFPADFALRNRYEISLEVDVVDNNNKESHGYKTFTVMRPGVLLLHGLMADARTFEAQYSHLLSRGGMSPARYGMQTIKGLIPLHSITIQMSIKL